jgi:uncharacterized protein (DUF1684 family)
MKFSVTLGMPGMFVLLAFCFSGFAQSQPDAKRVIKEHRRKQDQLFRSSKESPLLEKERDKFRGLKYYRPDLKYRVKATFVKNETPVFLKMKTTTSRLPEYVKYGEVRFLLNGESYYLEVYQSPEIIQRPGYEDYLFIPFTDLRNGETTYVGGRYIDFRMTHSEDVVLDFNKAYNPYCNYNPKYSCPIPPEVNHLPVRIEAGEKLLR